MKKSRTLATLILMVIASMAGFFAGAVFNEAINGAILFAMVIGITCIVYALDNCSR